jgi:hypothetical protein
MDPAEALELRRRSRRRTPLGAAPSGTGRKGPTGGPEPAAAAFRWISRCQQEIPLTRNPEDKKEGGRSGALVPYAREVPGRRAWKTARQRGNVQVRLVPNGGAGGQDAALARPFEVAQGRTAQELVGLGVCGERDLVLEQALEEVSRGSELVA